jgi:SAM-dependent methyltransferase
MNINNLINVKTNYKNGKNITEYLKNIENINYNTSQIIEIAYDLQAGSYIEHYNKNSTLINVYIDELVNILNNHIHSETSILDIGTGELTTLSLIINKLKNKPNNIFAFDISWSRIQKGLIFSKQYMLNNLHAFVADIKEIPLMNKSINITISSHALEPNGSNLRELMIELFRVTIDKLILFEPCYEINTEAGKSRMDKLGYIKNMDGIVKELNGKLLEKIVIKNTINSLNPTVCFIIEPPKYNEPVVSNNTKFFSIPGSNYNIIKHENYYFSNEVGFCYPIIQDIPILKSSSAILTTSLSLSNELE